MRRLGVILILAALFVAQILIGGTRLLYNIPACSLLALAAIATVWPLWRTSASAKPWCLIATLALCAYLLYRNRLSPVNYLARTDFFIILGSLIVYLLTALFLGQAKARMQILFGVLALALAHCVIGAIQFKRGDQYMLLPWIHRIDKVWRASGFYISPNHNAGLLEVSVILAISVVFWGRLTLARRLLVGYVGACCLGGLLISGSRGGYLSFGFGVVVLGIVSLATLRKVAPRRFLPGAAGLIGALVLAAAGICYIVLQSYVLKARVAEIHDPENMRWLLWGAAMEQFRLSPLLGTGSGTYLYYGRMFRDPAVQNDPIYVHNDYLHLLAEYGIAGATLFLLFLVTHLTEGVRNLKALASEQLAKGEVSSDRLALQIGGMSAIAAYVIHSLVDFNLHIPANAFLMALVFGMVANPTIVKSADPLFSIIVRNGMRVALIAAGIMVLAYGLPLLPGEWYAEYARAALRDHEVVKARDYAAKALQFEKRNPDIYYYAGEAARAMSASKEPADPSLAKEAVEMFKAGLAQFPQDVRTVYKLAETYDGLGEFDLAEEQLDRASELDPNASLLNAYYGMHYHSQGMLQEAEQQYERALELDSTNSIARAGLDVVEKALKPFNEEESRLQKELPEGGGKVDSSETPAPAAETPGPPQ